MCTTVLIAAFAGCNTPDTEETAETEQTIGHRWDLPEIGSEYRVIPYISAAIRLQSLSQDEALSELRSMATDRQLEDGVVILCRMLFTSRPDSDFRRPGLGGPAFKGGTNKTDWPLEPIEILDGIPFLITQGYILGGKREPAKMYLQYCVDNCDWSTTRFETKTDSQLMDALHHLVSAPKWLAPLSEYDIQFFRDQLK
jgi:hypothetical protein